MAEHRLMSDAQFKERVERRNKRLDRIDFLLEALLQKQNDSKSSFRGAMNSSQETLRQPFRSNHISHVAESSRKFKQRMAELSRENPIAKPSTPYLDSLVANLPIIAADIDKSSTANAQRNKEIPRANEFMVQSEPKSMVNTIGDCIGKIVESPLNKALPVTTIFSSSQDLISTHFFPNEDSAISDSEHADAINKDVVRNQGLSLHCEIPPALHFMSIGNKQASCLEPKFQLHCDKILEENTVVSLTASIQTCLSYVRQNVPTHSPPPKPPDCALLNPQLSLEPPNGVAVENHLMFPPSPKPGGHKFQSTQGELQVKRATAVLPPPPEPPDIEHIMVVLQEFVTLTFPKLIGFRSFYRNRYSVTGLISVSLSILSQLVVINVFDNNLYTMVSILSTMKLLSDASYALTCSVGLKVTTQMMLSLSRNVTMSLLLKPREDVFAARVALETNMPSPDYVISMLPLLGPPLIDEGKDYDMKQSNPCNLFSTSPHCRSHVFMHNKRVPPKSHCGIFQIYQCVVADKYLEFSHICGVKFPFKLRNGNWVYGFLAWFTYTHNLLSLASGTEKGTYHICYCLQLLPCHKNVNIGFYLFPKCTKCHSCGSNISRSGVKWFLGYTYQYACGEWFIKGNYCIVVEKTRRDLEQQQICQGVDS
ncbi:uncharacterized protein LOC123889681 [Trifolium pratense]|uniref:uncharacterized protein LOC123889681 n=1 Tax=Trifolium pratense TaxID=57577 RepID=UPI001E6925B1|nr:uncharacterized protein LOC123889681 [Trifolium pratense]